MTCVHHWVLAEGLRDVPARCRLCGGERVFKGMTDIDVVAFGAPFSPGAPRAYDPNRVRASRNRGGENFKIAAAADIQHGTQRGYRARCRCDECRAWKAQDRKRVPAGRIG